jgi:hypothetical protein
MVMCKLLTLDSWETNQAAGERPGLTSGSSERADLRCDRSLLEMLRTVLSYRRTQANETNETTRTPNTLHVAECGEGSIHLTYTVYA